MKLIRLWTLAFGLWALDLSAATYYVDNDNGNDNNAGLTTGTAWKTPSKVQSSISGGSLVYLRGTSVHTNRYDEAALGAFPGGSSWATATIFTSYPGETAEIKTQMPSGFYPFLFKFGSWIIVSNIVINCTNGFDGVVVTDSAHHIRFENVVIKDVPRSHCILIKPGSGSVNKYCELINSQFLRWGYNKQGGDHDLHGAYISTSSNLISGCFFSGSALGTAAIHHYTEGVNPLGNIFRNNRITGPQNGGGIIIAGGHDALAHDNVLYSLTAGRAFHIDQGSERTRIFHNTVNSCVGGIFVGNSSTTIGTDIENNIFVGTATGEGAIGIGTGASNTTNRNNIAYNNEVDYGNNGVNTTSSGNLFGSSYNAQFVNVGATNFAIQASSSARNAGLTLAGMTSDHIGTVRPQESIADIGAYEYSAGGQLPSVTVTASDNLATEQDLTTGAFTFTRSGSTVGSLIINFTVGGTAGSGTDYVSLGTSVIITNGQSTAIILVTPIDDPGVESDETVIPTISASGTYTVGTPSSATVTIRSDDIAPPLPPTPPGGGTIPGAGNDIPPFTYFEALEKAIATARKDLAISRIDQDTASRNIKDTRAELAAASAGIRQIYKEQTNTNARLQRIEAKLGIP